MDVHEIWHPDIDRMTEGLTVLTDNNLFLCVQLKKLKITSKEKEELKNIKIDHETSSEEQRTVESVLNTLNKVSKVSEKFILRAILENLCNHFLSVAQKRLDRFYIP